jgi:hypothetical protein
MGEISTSICGDLLKETKKRIEQLRRASNWLKRKKKISVSAPHLKLDWNPTDLAEIDSFFSSCSFMQNKFPSIEDYRQNFNLNYTFSQTLDGLNIPDLMTNIDLAFGCLSVICNIDVDDLMGQVNSYLPDMNVDDSGNFDFDNLETWLYT